MLPSGVKQARKHTKPTKEGENSPWLMDSMKS